MKTAADSPQLVPVVLIVDDEDDLRDMIATALRFHGFAPRPAANAIEAFSAVEREKPDLVVLDVNLPDVDGFEICRRMRAYGYDVPVIFLTAREEPDAIRAGFTGGGDDYLTKPFRVDELVLRINAVLRRTRNQHQPDDGRIVCGDLVVDDHGMRVVRSGDHIALSPTEFRLLHYLAINRDNIVSKYQILEHVWFDENDGSTSLVETYIGYLRKKIDARSPAMIHTVRGVGYVLRTPPLPTESRA